MPLRMSNSKSLEASNSDNQPELSISWFSTKFTQKRYPIAHGWDFGRLSIDVFWYSFWTINFKSLSINVNYIRMLDCLEIPLYTRTTLYSSGVNLILFLKKEL